MIRGGKSRSKRGAFRAASQASVGRGLCASAGFVVVRNYVNHDSMGLNRVFELGNVAIRHLLVTEWIVGGGSSSARPTPAYWL